MIHTLTQKSLHKIPFSLLMLFLFQFLNLTSSQNSTTLIFIHDWGTKSLEKAFEIRGQILANRKEVENILVPDWTKYSSIPDYYNVVKRYVPKVAVDVVNQIKILVDANGISEKSIEIVGHGAGGHIAGQVGKLWIKEKGVKIGKIVALDPSGPYFRDHESKRLNEEDATIVEIIHTDKRYGIYTNIGPNNTYPPSSNPILEKCTQTKLLKRNQCLHNAALDIYIQNLKNRTKNENEQIESRAKFSMSILTLDVSPSMQNHGRIQNSLLASKRLINSLPVGYFLGIVIFGGEAVEVLNPVNLTGDADGVREFMISKLPSPTTQINNTSIGAGILKALEMGRPYLSNGSFCPDIILVTDGEENQRPFLRDVEREIDGICTKIHTVALGEDADEGLEGLSERTGGQTYFSSDVNSLDKLTESLVASSTDQFSPETRPIHLPSKELRFNDPSGVNFTIDESVGKDTSFLISTQSPYQITADLISPNGQIFNSANYTTDSDPYTLLFKLLEVAPGNWTVKVNTNGKLDTNRQKRDILQNFNENTMDLNKKEILQKYSKNLRIKREARIGQNYPVATIQVATFPNDNDKNEVLRLEGYLDRRILDLDKNKSVNIEGHLRLGLNPIIGAKVWAILTSSGAKTEIELRDDGIGADEEKDDGIYTSSITSGLTPGKRYSVQVLAQNSPEGKTFIRSLEGDPFKISEDDMTLINYFFERQSNAGSFRVSKSFLNSTSNKSPPQPIRDLQIISISESGNSIELSFSPTSEKNKIHLSLFNENLTRIHTFSPADLETEKRGQVQKIGVKIPSDILEENKEYFIKIVTEDENGGKSEDSNLAPLAFGSPYVEEYENSILSTPLIIILVISVLLIVICVVFVVYRRKMAYFKVKNSTV